MSFAYCPAIDVSGTELIWITYRRQHPTAAAATATTSVHLRTEKEIAGLTDLTINIV